MSRGIFSPEELAELEAFDKQIEDEDEPLTLEEWRASMRRDRGLPLDPKPISEERKAKARERARERRAQNPEYYREAHRQWYAKNRAYAQAWQREYHRNKPDVRRKAQERLQKQLRQSEAVLRLRALRSRLGLTQAQLGAIFGVSQMSAHYWEAGKVHIPQRVLNWMDRCRAEGAAFAASEGAAAGEEGGASQ